MTKMNPYEQCPIYETEKLILRKTSEEDAKDLLLCYSDDKAVPFFNSDNCHTNFNFKTLEEMKNYMRFWEQEYEQKVYVRFSIIDKLSQRVIGNLEFCPKKDIVVSEKIAILRLDLASAYETQAIITDILNSITNNMYELFEVKRILTKAIPTATERISALLSCGFTELDAKVTAPYDHYYIR